MARSVLVTGGSGYFGTVLADARAGPGRRRPRSSTSTRPDRDGRGVEFVAGDVRDRDALRAACEGVDVVLHNVAQVPLAKDRDAVRRGERRAAPRTCSWPRATPASAKVVHTSSSAVFGIPERNPVTEDTPCRPLEAYGRAKLQAEVLCHEAVAAGLDVTIVRPRTILGHGRLGIMAILFEFVADGAPVFVLGGGDNRYQFVHADDLADACLRAADRPGPAVYNIGATEFGTMRETLQALVDHAATGSRVRSLPGRAGPAARCGRWRRSGWCRSRPYHWLLYGESLWFDIDEGPHRARLGAAALERVDGDRVVRVVPRAPRRRRRGIESHHQSPARLGALRFVKRLP